jgi:hypothetical protein
MGSAVSYQGIQSMDEASPWVDQEPSFLPCIVVIPQNIKKLSWQSIEVLVYFCKTSSIRLVSYSKYCSFYAASK